jgi:hypothetical protein
MSVKFHRKAVSVSQMAAMVGFSRQRFYQLLGRVFPWPVYDIATKRPFYPEELQKVCLEVRRHNCGIDGKPVLFYSNGHPENGQSAPKRQAKPRAEEYADIIGGLKSLGLSTTSGQVASAIKACFPGGIAGIDQGEVIRAVFLRLKQQNSGG